MSNNANSVRRNVRVLVEQFPELGESYMKLNMAYWSIFDDCQSISDLEHATPAETIRRNYQKLVETGILPQSKRIKEQREKSEEKRDYKIEFDSLG